MGKGGAVTFLIGSQKGMRKRRKESFRSCVFDGGAPVIHQILACRQHGELGKPGQVYTNGDAFV